VIVPYKSLGPELTADYHERTVLFAIRESALVVGTLLAAAVPLGIAALFDLSGDADGERFKFAVYGGVAAVVTVLACAWSVVDVPERPTASMPAAPGSRRVVAGVRDVLRNRPFAILLVAYTVIALGSNLPATLITYYVRYVLGREDVSIYLVLYFVIGIITMPLWVSLSGRIGKKNAWLAAMAINTLAFTPVFFLGHGQALWYAVCVGLSGTAGVAAIALPSSMQADVIEYDELRSGERREGQFVGLWSISEKFAAALGVGLSMPILEFAGYVPNVEQSPQVIDTLKVLYVVVPVACNALAFAIALRYPIDRSVHSAIQAAMVNKSRGLPFVDPLAAPYRDAKPSREAV
jgi:GPH family glycoside/pentoside/hexuronide:cation symporter